MRALVSEGCFLNGLKAILLATLQNNREDAVCPGYALRTQVFNSRLCRAGRPVAPASPSWRVQLASGCLEHLAAEHTSRHTWLAMPWRGKRHHGRSCRRPGPESHL